MKTPQVTRFTPVKLYFFFITATKAILSQGRVKGWELEPEGEKDISSAFTPFLYRTKYILRQPRGKSHCLVKEMFRYKRESCLSLLYPSQSRTISPVLTHPRLSTILLPRHLKIVKSTHTNATDDVHAHGVRLGSLDFEESTLS